MGKSITERHFLFSCISYLLIIPLLFSCQTGFFKNTTGLDEKGRKPKNVILLIGDGMGPQQLGLLLAYAQKAPGSFYKGRKTSFEKIAEHPLGRMGLMTHNPSGAIVIDSASAASQIATGVPTLNEVVGLDTKWKPVETVLEKAKKNGKSTGLVTDTRLTHATPAAFASHVPHRSLENEIAEQIVNSGNVDVLLGGGLRHWIPKSVGKDPAVTESLKGLIGSNNRHFKLKSKRKDEKNLLFKAQKGGHELVFDREQMERSEVKGNKLLGLFSYSGMENGLSHRMKKDDPQRIFPTLKDMTKKAISVLERNPKGFFLMVEAGQIDWAGHQNDAGTMLNEMVKFDEAIGAVLDWAKGRKDTVVIVTADHETGSFGFSYSKRNVVDSRKLQESDYKDSPFKPNFNFGPFSLLDKIYHQKKTLVQIIKEFKDSKKGIDHLIWLVEKNTHFKITKQEAQKIMEIEKNNFWVKNHKYLSKRRITKVEGPLKSFYVYPGEAHANNLGLMLSKKQNTVWGTGTHTNTPVPLLFLDTSNTLRGETNLKGLLSNTDLGKILKNIVMKEVNL